MKTPQTMMITTEKKIVAEAQVLVEADDDREPAVELALEKAEPRLAPLLPSLLHEGSLLRGFASSSSSIGTIYGDRDDDNIIGR
ncbi:hypothetical protein CRG98_034229 [Punica granatum]|uniref:Uncharacterized protein n=1 Tax=Punica granatum TaxID=22663 RepID=A0A2I0IN37_PUNGR|nr:hypothetical protein CRG98_034229 [Punica granatum]